MRSSILTAFTLLLVIPWIGCGRPAAVPSGAAAAAAKPDWQLVTLRIDGFKKSKSGGT